MEQRYFEARAMFGGMAPGMGMFDGYRKGKSFFASREADLDFDARVADDFTLTRPGFGGDSGRTARTDVL